MPDVLNFKISSALKDIIGKDLITDDSIAVFELIKNSFDAHATQVDIYFENINEPDTAKIIIKDNGKGMNYDDLLNKWLFVAYSAKREGTEDDNFDYRHKIFSNRHFAGAKGIGRFSCDRLGKILYLETTKHELKPKTEVLITEWEKFEGSIKQEFVDISVLHETKEKSDYGLEHGTVLEITELRSEWNRQKILSLKESLAKLINPHSEQDENSFKIIVHANEFNDDDRLSDEYHQVNGKVSNFIFRTLGLKTTKIFASITEDGKFINTELTDGGTLIYRIKESNSEYSFLNNIKLTIFYMNASAKNTFTRRMGLSSIRFGHIFLYKNGFRVYPYGEPGEDTLKIDARKAQGKQRYLGTYDILGQLEIFSNNNESDLDNRRELKETSSRGDGLIKTEAYYQLETFVLDALKRLEKYVVDVQRWGLSSIEDEVSFDLKTRASDLIARISGSNNIVDFETADNFFEILEASQSNSAETIVKNLNKIALESGNQALIEQSQFANAKLKEIQIAREAAEQQAEEERIKALKATEELREKVSENLFLKSINTAEFGELISLVHHIGIYAGVIDGNLKGISLRVQNKIPLSNEEIYDIIRIISFETKKILNVAAFATKANFKLDTELAEIDLNEYIREYIQNIIPSIMDKSLKISVNDSTSKSFISEVKPIELNIVIDNIINNAKKAKASQLYVELKENAIGKLEISLSDNGIGIKEENISKIYDIGFTTTDGSGLGLYHVKKIMDGYGRIRAENNISGIGAKLTLEFK